jgi:DNA-binding MarR family transcriptional regulator
MSSRPRSRPPARAAAIEDVANHLLPRASVLTRLLLRQSSTPLTRAEAGLLSALERGPHRISELAVDQALAQPTVTQLVGRLEARGAVARSALPGDARVVLVSSTESGRATLADWRAEYRAVLRDHLAGRSDAEVHSLLAATEILGDLIDSIGAEKPR